MLAQYYALFQFCANYKHINVQFIIILNNMSRGNLSFGNRLRGFRKTILDLTLQDLAKGMGITGTVLGRVERGEGTLDSDKMYVLHNVYKLNLNWLMSGIGSPTEESANYEHSAEAEQSEMVAEEKTEYSTDTNFEIMKVKLSSIITERDLYKKLCGKLEIEVDVLKAKLAE